MALFEDWCDCERTGTPEKRLWKFTENANGRAEAERILPDVIRSHYDDLGLIAEDIRQLGFTGAAVLLSERMPRSPRARSGEFGEILSVELVEEQIGFNVPVRRLRYKDGREMALRGDDFIGVRIDASGNLCLLKGESKSRASLGNSPINEARTALSRDHGRPTATSLLFVADRLMEYNDERADIGRHIRNEVAIRSMPAERIDHVLFTVSGNTAPAALAADLARADNVRTHTVIHLRIDDHQEFIRSTYQGALALGNP